MAQTRSGSDVVEHAIGPTGVLALHIPAGDVEVRAVDGDVARVRDPDGHDLEEQYRIDRQPGRLVLRPRDKVIVDLGFVRRGRTGGRLMVEVPAAASVSIETASGRVRVAGLVGDQRYRTASGAVELEAIAGTVGIDAVSGSVTMTAAGELDLSGRLVSGDLRLRGGRLRSAAIATTSGDLDLLTPLAGPGPYSVQTVSGDVRVVTGGAGLRVDAKTVTGHVSSDIAHRSSSERGNRMLMVGEGRLELVFKSISGDLRVAGIEPGSGGAASQASSEPPAPPAPPSAPEPPAPSEAFDAPARAMPDSAADADHDTRLRILRELESGAIDVETAGRRLAALEDSDA